jgi:hypothetical protein
MNNGTNPYTMHPHGVKYDKANEGAWYKYGTSKGDNVQPGESYEYTVSVSHKLNIYRCMLCALLQLRLLTESLQCYCLLLLLAAAAITVDSTSTSWASDCR